MLWSLPVLGLSLLACGDPDPVERPPPFPEPEPEPLRCLGAPPCEVERRIAVDPDGPGGEPPVMVAYDHAEVTRRVRLAKMGQESDLSVAVRLLLGEVGPERLLINEHAREESLAVLSTVSNRLDPAAWNPEDKPARPWPGCEQGASFAGCARPDQYLGLRAWRALHPAEHVPEDQLLPAVEASVRAWWLLATGAAEDPTGGATSFVHRCGGAAYGQPTTACDGVGDDDVEGAEPSTGPVVFRGPQAWDEDEGRYRMWRRHQVEFERKSAE